MWNQLTLDEKCEVLQHSIVDGNTAAYGGAKLKSARKVIQLKKLRKVQQGAEKQRNKLSVERANRKVRNETWSLEDQEALTAATMHCFNLGGR